MTNPDDSTKGFVGERALMMASSARITWLPIVLIGSLVAFTYWSVSGSYWLPILWMAAITALLLFRGSVVASFNRNEISASQFEAVFARFSYANGFIMGLGFLFSMQLFSIEWQAIVTMFGVSIIAGAVSASALNPKVIGPFTYVSMGFMALSWLVYGKLEPAWFNPILAGLVLGFAALTLRFVKASEQRAQQAFGTQDENARLVIELRQNQDELIRQRDLANQANLAKSRFLAAASHDLRQPLHTITLFNATLALRPLDERSQWLVDQTGNSVAALSSLLDSLLDLSKLDSQKTELSLKAIALAPLLEHIHSQYSPQALQRDISFELLIERNKTIQTDAIYVERIVRNLIDNALKHGARKKVMLVLGESNQGAVQIRVIDDGPGIPLHSQGAIFEEFYQLNNDGRDRSKGIGLGLAIVKRLCDQIDARCFVDSSDAGAVFTVEFKAKPD